MSLKISELKKRMIEAAKTELGDRWPEIRIYAESEARKIAETVTMVAKLLADDRISLKEAKLHLRIQANASKTVLLTVEGLGLLAVEGAINAAIDSLKAVVNEAIGRRLI